MLLHHGDGARPIAGGTALQIFMHLGLLKVPYLVDLAGIPGLNSITLDGDWLVIGAMTPLADVARHRLVREYLPALAETYLRVANPRVRTTATAGGNLCHGDYRLDPPAMLLPLGAEVETASGSTTRRLPLAEFFVGLEETVLRQGEILTSIRIPLSNVPDRAVFWKFSSLAANDWPCFGAGACLWLEDGSVREAKVGVTAMAPTPMLFEPPMLAGRQLTPELAREAGEFVAGRVDPIPDLRGSAEYKRRITAVNTADALMSAVGAGLVSA